MTPALLALLLLADDPAVEEACVPTEQLCEVIDPGSGRPRTWPADVQALEDDAFACIHFGGEPYDSPDSERGRFVIAQVRKACNAVHRALPGLKGRYRRDAAIRARLANIEAWYGGPID